MWLVGRLAPDFKTIVDFRRDNGAAIRAVCSQFVVLCRQQLAFLADETAVHLMVLLNKKPQAGIVETMFGGPRRRRAFAQVDNASVLGFCSVLPDRR